MNYQFYIIFHKDLYKECYKDLKQEYYDKIKFFAVNSKILKKVPEKNLKDNKIIIERELPYYNPLWQHSNFCEDSAFLHVYKNHELLLDSYDYIGFFQYDMILNNDIFEQLEFTLQNHPEKDKLLFYFYKENSYRHLDQVICLDGWRIIIDIYNKLFNTNHSVDLVVINDIPLYHCYVMPKNIFNKMMQFLESVFPVLFELLGCETKHLPYHLERCHGIFLFFQLVENKLPHWFQMPGIIHSDDLKDPWQQNKNA